jgi:hypothetical protein
VFDKFFSIALELFTGESDAWPRLPTSSESKDLFQQQQSIDYESDKPDSKSYN